MLLWYRLAFSVLGLCSHSDQSIILKASRNPRVSCRCLSVVSHCKLTPECAGSQPGENGNPSEWSFFLFFLSPWIWLKRLKIQNKGIKDAETEDVSSKHKDNSNLTSMIHPNGLKKVNNFHLWFCEIKFKMETAINIGVIKCWFNQSVEIPPQSHLMCIYFSAVSLSYLKSCCDQPKLHFILK